MDSEPKHLQDPTVTHRIFKLITGMSEDERHTLLDLLEKGLLKGKCRRGYLRKKIRLPVAYADETEIYRSFTKDISLGGVFILTSGPLKVGDEIRVLFKTDKKETLLKIFGKVARVTSEGIGVMFTAMDNDRKTAILSITSTG